MCSKKCAKPDLPGSTSFREPVITGTCTETMFGKPVGTISTFKPFGRVFSVTWNGRMSSDLGGACAKAGAASDAISSEAARAFMNSPI